MKKMILLALINLPFLLSAQTEELEKAHLNSLINSGKVSQTELTQLGKSWRGLLERFGGYPILPYNKTSRRIEFIEVLEFPGKQKNEIVDLVKEWISINYGNIQEVLHYENSKGKLIAKGFFRVSMEGKKWNFFGKQVSDEFEAKCFHTVVFTVRDGKMKMEHRDLEYHYRIPSSTAGGVYVPAQNIETNLLNLYPVTAGPKSGWEGRLQTIQNAAIEIERSEQSIKRYIDSATAYNNF